MIFNNLTRIIDIEKDERVLVVFGQGHTKLLRDFINEYEGYELVEVKEYLKYLFLKGNKI